MVVLRIAGPVRQALGVDDVRQLQAGLTLPARVQCYCCHDHIDTHAADTVELSAVQVAATMFLTAWSHPGCAVSRVLTTGEFDQAAVKVAPAPGLAFGVRDEHPLPEGGGPTSLIIDGRPFNL